MAQKKKLLAKSKIVNERSEIGQANGFVNEGFVSDESHRHESDAERDNVAAAGAEQTTSTK